MTKKSFAKKTETIEVRVAPETKQRFVERCEDADSSASSVLRALMDDYVASGGRAPRKSIWQELRMSRLLAHPIARLAAVAGGVLALGSVSAPLTAADPRLEALFVWFDQNGDGRLTQPEMLSQKQRNSSPLAGAEIALTSKGERPENDTMAQIFARIDGDGDGRVSLSELSEGVAVTSRLDEGVMAADRDRDRKLTTAELAAHITARRAADGLGDPSAGAALLAEGLVRTHDRDGDGKVGIADLGA